MVERQLFIEHLICRQYRVTNLVLARFYLIAENLRERKHSREIRGFSARNLGRSVLWRSKCEQSAKVFSAKITNSRESFLLRKFSPSKVSRYTVYLSGLAVCCDLIIHACCSALFGMHAHAPHNILHSPSIFTHTMTRMTASANSQTSTFQDAIIEGFRIGVF